MELNPFEHLFNGILIGLTEILPVSARAHSIILLKLLGAETVRGLPSLLIHIAILAALFLSSRSQLIKMSRARRLARIPKKKRKRPLDVSSLMDSRFLFTMAAPMLPLLLCYDSLSTIRLPLPVIALFLFLNGMVLYMSQYLPSSNRNASQLSRVNGLLMGLGAVLSIIPGFSGLGFALAIGSVCGVEKVYGLNMALILQMFYVGICAVHDILKIFSIGFGLLTPHVLLFYLLAAIAAFLSAMLSIRIMRALAAEYGYSLFAYYCWGFALFAFILNLMA